MYQATAVHQKTPAERDPQATSKQHDGSNPLNRKLRVGTNGMDIVVETKQKNESARHKNCQKSPNRETSSQCRKIQTGQQRNSNSYEKG